MRVKKYSENRILKFKVPEKWKTNIKLSKNDKLRQRFQWIILRLLSSSGAFFFLFLLRYWPRHNYILLRGTIHPTLSLFCFTFFKTIISFNDIKSVSFSWLYLFLQWETEIQKIKYRNINRNEKLLQLRPPWSNIWEIVIFQTFFSSS